MVKAKSAKEDGEDGNAGLPVNSSKGVGGLSSRRRNCVPDARQETRAKASHRQMMMVSMKVPVMEMSPCSAGHFVLAAALR